jgi:hypothetical protein
VETFNFFQASARESLKMPVFRCRTLRKLGIAMAICWDQLSAAEQQALVRLARGPYLTLTIKTAKRLKQLGLAEQKLGGSGISREGLDLVRANQYRLYG